MEFYRATEKDLKYIKYKKSFIHSTALLACEDNEIIAVFEYEISNKEEAEIINFRILKVNKEEKVFKDFIGEMSYWNPYLKRIIYSEQNNFISKETLVYCGFRKNSTWLLETNSVIKVFKIDIEEITPEQLTINKEKLERVNSWIQNPEDIIVSCVKLGDKLVSIDGHSRLVAAYNKGFKYVYAYEEIDNVDVEFYKTCIEWCREQNILTIQDLAFRVVTPEGHERQWINRCQAYFSSPLN